MRLVASGVSLPSSLPLALVGELIDDDATIELPREGFSDVGLSLWPSLKKEVGKTSR